MAMIIVNTHCQRPPYAGTSNHHHHILPQYLENKENSTDQLSVVNRVDGSPPMMMPEPRPERPYRDPAYLPPQAAGDWNLVDLISTWPEERQPFWYINWKKIQEHIGGKQPPASLFPLKPIKN